MVDTIGPMGSLLVYIYIGSLNICGEVEYCGVRKSHTLSIVYTALRSC